MEQEVFVPVPARRLRAALADPAQVARAVPGLQQDAGTEPVAGRLKVRVAGHTITYRGTARITAREDGAYAVEGDATEVRGSGAVKLALVVRPRDTDGGTTLRFEGTASADGRVAELPQDAVIAAVARILNRFAENLGTGSAGVEGETGAGESPVTGEATATEPTDADEPNELAESADAEADAVEDPEAPVEPPAEPPAEAAHARRTMIGRSAEEVDHAPPRGRYAPVPAPQTVAQNSTLRWAAPAAALVVASAIVVGRALRRRR
ncbi:SRPBCC family protein [Streptomyces sp. CAI-85]|uniref:SRPBCC family protein n=1 Tax=Streptomyces sp. CAI-85 TaxID=1472662 RepID=UPI00158700F0|nr:SRPBCC family protein [Streptomyces sp. CAI-85]NUV64763.1 carbon monoxide dehydrogenase subunit G [Streptomyces sp. CAI-85]